MSTQQSGRFGSTLGAQPKPGASDVSALQARIAELETQLQSERVEQGRVKALSQRIKELERELAETKARELTLPDSIASTISPEVHAALKEVYRQQLVAGARAPLDQASTNPVDERIAMLEKRQEEERQHTNAMRQAEMERRLDEKYPGISGSIAAGGDKNSAWLRFLDTHGASVRVAWDACDFSKMCEFLDLFLSQIGASQAAAERTRDAGGSSPGNQPGGATPPSGAAGSGEGKTMTFEEYESAMEKAQRDFQYGTLSAPEYRKTIAELERAMEEGRVKFD